MADMNARRVALVTGATGFVGAALTDALVAAGYRTHVLVNSTASGKNLWRLASVASSIDIIEGNLLDPFAIRAALARAQPSVVFHIGGFSHTGRSWSRASECWDVNTEGTLNLLKAIAEVGTNPRLVLASTSEVYGGEPVPWNAAETTTSPQSVYAASKLASEHLARVFADQGFLSVVAVRLHNVFGPRQLPDRLIPEAIRAALSGSDLHISAGDQTRDFIFIDDAVAAFVAAGVCELARTHLEVDVGTGTEMTVKRIVEAVYERVGLGGSIVVSRSLSRPNEILRAFSDPRATCAALAWAPGTSFAAGLGTTIDWYREHGDDLR
jgi:UDP-glucose 4-epimerase